MHASARLLPLATFSPSLCVLFCSLDERSSLETDKKLCHCQTNGHCGAIDRVSCRPRQITHHRQKRRHDRSRQVSPSQTLGSASQQRGQGNCQQKKKKRCGRRQTIRPELSTANPAVSWDGLTTFPATTPRDGVSSTCTIFSHALFSLARGHRSHPARK